MDPFNCSDIDFSIPNCSYWREVRLRPCDPETLENITRQYNEVYNCTAANYERGLTAALIFIVSLIGNIGAIALLSKFKIHKIPDVLVIGLAITDLVATLIPVPLSLYAYFADYQLLYDDWLCILYATLAQFTRYTSVLIVTIVSVERYLAVIHPFFYRKHATPKKVVVILLICWFTAGVLAIVPAVDPSTKIFPHEGFCLFDIASDYSYAILVYGIVQYIIVLFCFVAVTVQLGIVYRRRKKLKVQKKHNRQSNAQERQQHEVKFAKPNLTTRISDLSKSLRKAAPAMVEKFQFGVEAQFAFMLFVVVILFYLSWTAMLTIIAIAHIRNTGQGLEEALFWGIRLSVISTAINPLVYGILARQYRLAYWYVIKLVLSKFCCCVSPPLKDVFASARAPGGGDVRSEASVHDRRRRFKQQGQNGQNGQNGSVGKFSLPESYWGRSTEESSLPVTSPHLRVALPSDLEAIDEADFEYNRDSSVVEDHSTFVSSVGELASSVIIPHQVRDKNSDTDLTRTTLRTAASLDNLTDGLLSDFGCSQDPHQGVNNPMVNVLADGESISPPSEQSSTNGDAAFQIGRLYANPVYQIELARRRREGSGGPTSSSLVAASSADDITLVSKAVLHEPTHASSLITITNKESTPQSQENHTEANHTPLQTTTVASSQSKPAEGIERKEVKVVSKRPVDKRLEQMKRLQLKPVSKSQEFSIATAEGTGNNKRSSLTIEPVSDIVQGLRRKFDAPTTPTSPPTHIPPPQTNGKPGRCNSVGNSDSGRESMVLETDV